MLYSIKQKRCFIFSSTLEFVCLGIFILERLGLIKYTCMLTHMYIYTHTSSYTVVLKQ
jgi:hypothetical protein